jgi:ribosomal protein L37AE/L43A
MNVNISESTIDKSRKADPSAARSEWDAEFRADLESFIPVEVVEARIVAGRREFPPSMGITYSAFVDPSGGSSDSFTLAVAHLERDHAVLDVLREITAPFSPEDAVKEFVGILRQYRISTVTGDAYAGEWPREQFRKHSVNYRVSEKHRSELYLSLLPLLMSGQAELLDHPRLKNQLINLDRRTGSTGKDSIDHVPGSHDDVANAAAGALVGVVGVTLQLGYVNLVLSEVAKHEAAAVVQHHEGVVGCPECGHLGIVKRGGNWLCTHCAYAWTGPAPVVDQILIEQARNAHR